MTLKTSLCWCPINLFRGAKACVPARCKQGGGIQYNRILTPDYGFQGRALEWYIN